MAKVLICGKNTPEGWLSALSEIGHEVKVTGTLDEALATTSAYKPELLIADWALDGNDCGIELAARLQKRCPGIKTLLCSGMPEAAAAVCDARGILRVSVISRPFQTPNLVEKVREICPEQAARF